MPWDGFPLPGRSSRLTVLSAGARAGFSLPLSSSPFVQKQISGRFKRTSPPELGRGGSLKADDESVSRTRRPKRRRPGWFSPTSASTSSVSAPQCKKKHTLVCPDFSKTGSCPQGACCKLQHRQRAQRSWAGPAAALPGRRARSREPASRSEPEPALLSRPYLAGVEAQTGRLGSESTDVVRWSNVKLFGFEQKFLLFAHQAGPAGSTRDAREGSSGTTFLYFALQLPGGGGGRGRPAGGRLSRKR